MSEIVIYYLKNENIGNFLSRNGIELDHIVREGDRNMQMLVREIKTIPRFCRDESAISLSHLMGTFSANIILYALVDDKLAGILTFMFNENSKRERTIEFDGICSPETYKGTGLGASLIRTLIDIARGTGTSYIHLECKGDDLMRYYRTFGFKVTGQKRVYDSDESSDEEGVPNYTMALRVSVASGGKRRKQSNKTNKKTKKSKCFRKKRQTRRKRFRL